MITSLHIYFQASKVNTGSAEHSFFSTKVDFQINERQKIDKSSLMRSILDVDDGFLYVVLTFIAVVRVSFVPIGALITF